MFLINLFENGKLQWKRRKGIDAWKAYHSYPYIYLSNKWHINTSYVCSGDCGPGTYVNEAGDDCIDCPLGEYQDQRRASKCKPCGSNLNTSSTGAKSVSECQGKNRWPWSTNPTILKIWKLFPTDRLKPVR